MNATAVAQAGPQAGTPDADTALTRRLNASIELFRIDATLHELEAMPPCRDASHRGCLIKWYRGRRAVLAKELGL